VAVAEVPGRAPAGGTAWAVRAPERERVLVGAGADGAAAKGGGADDVEAMEVVVAGPGA
jgi:hypothetical protein